MQSPTPIRIAALTRGHADPASRFRIRQHIEPLRTQGIHVVEHMSPVDDESGTAARLLDRLPGPVRLAAKLSLVAAKTAGRVPGVVCARQADCTWLGRELISGLYTLEGFAGRPCVLDVDDAIWLKRLGRAAIPRLARRMDAVVAGNAYLAEWFGSYSSRVFVVPTAIDTERFRPADRADEGTDFVIAWTGTSSNFPSLRGIQESLATFLRTHRDSRLLIVADRSPRLELIPPDQLTYITWSPQSEVTALQCAAIGIMPLEDTPWTRGKCSFKMLQYMAVGLPVVASPVGMNADVLAMGALGFGPATPGEWVEALEALKADAGLRRTMGNAGRAVAVSRFDRGIVATQLAGVFRGLVDPAGTMSHGGDNTAKPL